MSVDKEAGDHRPGTNSRPHRLVRRKNRIMNDAQLFYDLRALTGYCSGMDLYEFFRTVCGDPSPKGNTVLPMAHLFMPQEMYEVLSCGKTKELLAMVSQYTSPETAMKLKENLASTDLLKDALRLTVEFDERQ